MRTKKRTPDYGAISRRSIQNDFKRVQSTRKGRNACKSKIRPKINAERRVLFISENSAYYRYRSFFVGKLVRLIKQSNVGGWIVGFVYDDDRKAINHAAGWSDMKKEYLLDGVKFK